MDLLNSVFLSILRQHVSVTGYQPRNLPIDGPKSCLLKCRGHIHFCILSCPRFYTITATCYRRAMGIMVVYDVTDEKSYTNLTKWINNIAENASKNVVKILVANKCDLEEKRQVSRGRGQSLADELEISYVEVSALSNSNIEEAFTGLSRDILKRVVSCGEDESSSLGNEDLKAKGSVCQSC